MKVVQFLSQLDADVGDLVLTDLAMSKNKQKIRGTDVNGTQHAMWRKNFATAIKQEIAVVDTKAETVTIGEGFWGVADDGHTLINYGGVRKAADTEWAEE